MSASQKSTLKFSTGKLQSILNFLRPAFVILLRHDVAAIPTCCSRSIPSSALYMHYLFPIVLMDIIKAYEYQDFVIFLQYGF